MSFIDRTQQYRQGVLIGNWNEDAYGMDLVRAPPEDLPPAERYKSIAHASYVRPSDAALRETINLRISSIDRRRGIGQALVAQPGVEPGSEYKTSYSYYGGGVPGTIPPDYTLSKQTIPKTTLDKAQAADIGSRRISTRTEARDNFTTTHSLLALSNSDIREAAANRIAHTKKMSELTATVEHQHAQHPPVYDDTVPGQHLHDPNLVGPHIGKVHIPRFKI